MSFNYELIDGVQQSDNSTIDNTSIPLNQTSVQELSRFATLGVAFAVQIAQSSYH